MATVKMRIYIRCAESNLSEINGAAIWEIEYLLEKQLVFLMQQLSGGPVVVEQILVERDPLDSIGGDVQKRCP